MLMFAFKFEVHMKSVVMKQKPSTNSYFN